MPQLDKTLLRAVLDTAMHSLNDAQRIFDCAHLTKEEVYELEAVLNTVQATAADLRNSISEALHKMNNVEANWVCRSCGNSGIDIFGRRCGCKGGAAIKPVIGSTTV